MTIKIKTDYAIVYHLPGELAREEKRAIERHLKSEAGALAVFFRDMRELRAAQVLAS